MENSQKVSLFLKLITNFKQNKVHAFIIFGLYVWHMVYFYNNFINTDIHISNSVISEHLHSVTQELYSG